MNDCTLFLKGHRLCIVSLMVIKGLMLRKHSALKKADTQTHIEGERAEGMSRDGEANKGNNKRDGGTAREKRTEHGSEMKSPEEDVTQELAPRDVHTYDPYILINSSTWQEAVNYVSPVWCFCMYTCITGNRSWGLMGRVGQVGLEKEHR